MPNVSVLIFVILLYGLFFLRFLYSKWLSRTKYKIGVRRTLEGKPAKYRGR